MFKVVPDQLRISEGWVRCGQCDEVFDANAHLQSNQPADSDSRDSTAIAQAGAPLESASVMDPAPFDSGTVEESGSEFTEASADQTEISDSHTYVDVPLGEPEPDYAAHADPFLEKSPHELSQFVGAVVARGLRDELLRESEEVSEMAAEPRYVQAGPTAAAPAADARLSFMRPMPKVSGRGRTVRRVVSIMVCCALALALFLQVAYSERNRIAATVPDLQPLLSSICRLLDCKISSPHEIEAVVIDNSAFTKVRQSVYRLNFTLKNTASTVVATPALELTLTDLQDRPLLRRILVPHDFGLAQEAIGANAELTASIPLAVNPADAAEHISGYRLLAFYP